MVPTPSRRSLLELGATVGIGGVVGIAGCTSVFGKRPELRIRNSTTERRAITVQVTSAVTGREFVDDEFRIPPGGPHVLAREVFPSPGEYDVCASTAGTSERCETWTIERDHPEYHITLNPTTEGRDPHFTMGRYDRG